MLDSELLEEFLLLGTRAIIVGLHMLHAAGIVAAGALVAVTLLWTVEEIIELHKGTHLVKAKRSRH